MVIFALVSLTLAAVAVFTLKQAGRVKLPLDIPNDRSLHETPVPRIGGVAVLAGLVVAMVGEAIFSQRLLAETWLLGGLIPLVLVGLIDDCKGVSAIKRLMFQGASGCYLVIVLYMLTKGNSLSAISAWLAAAGLVGAVWSINAYNFMDGMDGIAGSMGVIGFLSFASIGYSSGHDNFGLISLFIASAIAGFLIFNWPKASIFLGDAGSTSIGYLSAALAAWGVLSGHFPVWVPFLVFSPFWVDATVTLLKRAFRGEKVWEAHREHYYQRLVLMGWGHKKTLYVEIVLMMACAVSAVLGTFLSFEGQMTVVAVWVLVYVIILTAFPAYERRHSSL